MQLTNSQIRVTWLCRGVFLWRGETLGLARLQSLSSWKLISDRMTDLTEQEVWGSCLIRIVFIAKWILIRSWLWDHLRLMEMINSRYSIHLMIHSIAVGLDTTALVFVHKLSILLWSSNKMTSFQYQQQVLGLSCGLHSNLVLKTL